LAATSQREIVNGTDTAESQKLQTLERTDRQTDRPTNEQAGSDDDNNIDDVTDGWMTDLGPSVSAGQQVCAARYNSVSKLNDSRRRRREISTRIGHVTWRHVTSRDVTSRDVKAGRRTTAKTRFVRIEFDAEWRAELNWTELNWLHQHWLAGLSRSPLLLVLLYTETRYYFGASPAVSFCLQPHAQSNHPMHGELKGKL